jgi:hypothetical protein
VRWRRPPSHNPLRVRPVRLVRVALLGQRVSPELLGRRVSLELLGRRVRLEPLALRVRLEPLALLGRQVRLEPLVLLGQRLPRRRPELASKSRSGRCTFSNAAA